MSFQDLNKQQGAMSTWPSFNDSWISGKMTLKAIPSNLSTHRRNTLFVYHAGDTGHRP